MLKKFKTHVEGLSPLGELGLAMILGVGGSIIICGIIATIAISLGAK